MGKSIISKLRFMGLVFAAVLIAGVLLPTDVNAATTIKYDPQMTDEELKKSIAESNKVSDVINEGGYFRETRFQGIDKVNYIDSVYGYDDYVLRDSDWGDTFVDTRLASFGYFGIYSGKKIVRLFDDELWQYSTNDRLVGSLDEEYNPYEHYTERYFNNGMLYTRSRITPEGISMDVLKTDGVDVSKKIDFIEEFREIDPDTLRIRKSIESVKYADEKEPIPYVRSVWEYCKDNPCKAKESQLFNDIFGGENHTIKIIAKVGTKDEREYSIAANKDAYLDYWIRSSDHNFSIFMDSECTIPAECDADEHIKFDSDKILYMK